MDKIILDKINKTGDVKNIPENELPMLSQEIRDFLVQKLSVTGGHLASNLSLFTEALIYLKIRSYGT